MCVVKEKEECGRGGLVFQAEGYKGMKIEEESWESNRNGGEGGGGGEC